jgi:hypothetical protein
MADGAGAERVSRAANARRRRVRVVDGALRWLLGLFSELPISRAADGAFNRALWLSAALFEVEAGPNRQ